MGTAHRQLLLLNADACVHAADAAAALVLAVLWLLLTLRPPLRTAGSSVCICGWLRPYTTDLFWDVMLAIFNVVSARGSCWLQAFLSIRTLTTWPFPGKVEQASVTPPCQMT
jgi:hypothetical protein